MRVKNACIISLMALDTFRPSALLGSPVWMYFFLKVILGRRRLVDVIKTEFPLRQCLETFV